MGGFPSMPMLRLPRTITAGMGGGLPGALPIAPNAMDSAVPAVSAQRPALAPPPLPAAYAKSIDANAAPSSKLGLPQLLLLLAAGGPRGVAMGLLQQSALRREEDQIHQHEAASVAAYRAAFSPDGTFDSDRYLKSMADQALVPNSEDLARYETISGQRADRTTKRQAEQRGLAASIAAPLRAIPIDQRDQSHLDAARQSLVQATGMAPEQAVALMPDLSDRTLNTLDALGMGAKDYETMQGEAATRQETGRHNLATESQGAQSVSETGRHNRAEEGIGFGNLGVNRAQEHRLAGQGGPGGGNKELAQAIRDELARRKAARGGR